MILVDTSIWIRAFARIAPYVNALDDLLAVDQVAGHDLIYGELLMGDRGGRREFLKEYAAYQRMSAIPHDEAVLFALHRRLHGRGIGWIDVHLLASALANDLQLWTADESLREIARELNIAYEI